VKDTEIVTKSLQMLVDSAKKQVAEFAVKMSRDLGGAEYQMRWMADLPKTVYLGRFAQLTLDVAQEKGFEEGMACALSHFERELATWYPNRSTSPYANAVNDERFEALRDFLEKLKGWAR
jgi:hypothetical protein